MAASNKSASQGRILVIDDDLAIRVLLEAVLTRMQFDVTLAEDGQAGLDELQKNRFDLVLLDLMMPKVSGYDFLARFKSEVAPDRQPHIIVFTAAGKRGVEKIPPGSICDFILKPFDLTKFVDMIRRCTEGTHESSRHSI